MNGSIPAIFDDLSTLSDMTRGRILLLLEQGELAVSELCAVLQAPQSTVSRHLKALQDEGWLSSHREGTSRRYCMALNGRAADRMDLWRLIRQELSGAQVARKDAERLKAVLAERRARSREFFSGSVADWDRLRDDLFGSRFHLEALPGLLDSRWIVADLGCGTGQLVEALSTFVRRVIGIDESESMVKVAMKRLDGVDNVEIHHCDLESLPLANRFLDAATMILVLHHLAHPAGALSEVARVLKPGGRLLLADMVPHDRMEYHNRMGHLWLGFSESTMARYLGEAGFERVRYRRLPVDPQARGPALFAVTASKQ